MRRQKEELILYCGLYFYRPLPTCPRQDGAHAHSQQSHFCRLSDLLAELVRHVTHSLPILAMLACQTCLSPPTNG